MALIPRSVRLVVALFLVHIALTPAGLLAQVADAVIEISAVDASDQVLPGVSVLITNTATGAVREVTTSANGTARVAALPPGTYDVKSQLAGFATVAQRIVLRVGETGRLTVAMTIAAVSETVNVTATATPLVDVFKTDSSSNIVPEQIEALPVPDRDFQRLAFLAPGVQRERGGFRFIGGGPVIGAGGNASQSTILVDGVDFTDQTLGLARARFSQDAVSEFRVIANRFDTEIGGSAGGALSIVTKTGTNTASGSVFGFFRDDKLREKGTLDLQKNPYSRQQFGATFGGPIVKDKTHFFASVERVQENNIALYRPGGAYASQAADVPVPVDQTLLFGGLSHQINTAQSLRARFVYEQYRQDNFRVGGLADTNAGMALNRDNWNVVGTHVWAAKSSRANQLSFQLGGRKFTEPNNSQSITEWFSLGNTLQTGAGIVGDQVDDGKIFEVRDTFYLHLGQGRFAHDLKIGGAWQRVNDTWDFPVYPQGLLLYLNDTRTLPVIYYSVTGSGKANIATNMISGFVQDDLRPSSRLTINLGLRYDLDTNGNNPSFTSPLMPTARGRDANNLQPRGGFSWDLRGDGSHVVRGGAGMFTGRFLLVPAFSELQQNGFTGRIIQQRWSSLLFGTFTALLNPAALSTSGIALNRDLTRMADSLVNPQSTQFTAGYTARLGGTGLYLDFEGIYVKGTKEIVIRDANFCGNSSGFGCRVNKSYGQINTYTNDGHSEYKAFVTSVNGTLKGGHLVTASFTVASKKNINDDFSPALTDYPSDPADIGAEYGRSRADERYHFVASSVLRLPLQITLAPIFEYGSGQPWNARRGYDYNGDGKSADRATGIGRFSEKGPNYASFNLRLNYQLKFGSSRAAVDLIAEAFNLFNRVNNDVNSAVTGQYLSGPTLANPAAAAVTNTRYGQYLSTLPPREFQLGLRVKF